VRALRLRALPHHPAAPLSHEDEHICAFRTHDVDERCYRVRLGGSSLNAMPPPLSPPLLARGCCRPSSASRLLRQRRLDSIGMNRAPFRCSTAPRSRANVQRCLPYPLSRTPRRRFVDRFSRSWEVPGTRLTLLACGCAADTRRSSRLVKPRRSADARRHASVEHPPFSHAATCFKLAKNRGRLPLPRRGSLPTT
jgi:hypothetical protein